MCILCLTFAPSNMKYGSRYCQKMRHIYRIQIQFNTQLYRYYICRYVCSKVVSIYQYSSKYAYFTTHLLHLHCIAFHFIALHYICTGGPCIVWKLGPRKISNPHCTHCILYYSIDANTTALLIRVALSNFLLKSPIFKANTRLKRSNFAQI